MSRVAIVTGAASGIGRALAAAAVRRAGHVVVADIDVEEADAVATKLDARGPGSAEPAEVDVRDQEAVRDLVRRTYERRGRLDFLFNNAGIGVGGAAQELEVAHWQRAVEVNLLGVVYGVHAAYPLMIEQGFGHIVNTASVAGLVPTPFAVPYATTKHGVVGLTLSLRPEAAVHGIALHVVCPGVVETPILDTLGPDDLPRPPSMLAIDSREFLTRVGGPPYPPERLAEDVMRGIARGDAVITAPRRARVIWALYRGARRAVERALDRIAESERELLGA